jgi:hypothetical protein
MWEPHGLSLGFLSQSRAQVFFDHEKTCNLSLGRDQGQTEGKDHEGHKIWAQKHECGGCEAQYLVQVFTTTSYNTQTKVLFM